MIDSRNPPQPESAEETAEESDSGEGKLGGPNGSLHGSSSALTGAGVGAVNLRGGAGSIGAGAQAQADSSLMTRQNSLGELNGQPLFGPERPPHLREYGDQGSNSWSFDTLDNAGDANDEAGSLLNTVDGDDAASTTAEMDTTLEDGYGSRMQTDFEGANGGFSNERYCPSAGRNSPADGGYMIYHEDNHALYSTAHGGQDDADVHALHLEDAGWIGGGQDTDEEMETVDIYPDPPTPHEKSD